jgi:DNA-binding transcriptional MerR regulator
MEKTKKAKYLIGDVANLMGLSRDTLRYYEKRGILSSQRGDNGYRYYTDQDISRLISILYQRKMDIGLRDMETLWTSENSVDDLTAIMDSRLKEEEQTIRLHQQNIARLQLTKTSCEDVRCNLGRISLQEFPAAYIIIPHTDLPKSVEQWFSYSQRYPGLDMMYTFSEFSWCHTDDDKIHTKHKNSQLVLFENLKDYVDYPITDSTPKTPQSMLCVSSLCACKSLTPSPEDLLPMIHWAEKQGFMISRHFYSTYASHGRMDGLDTCFVRIYIPVF